MSTLGVSHSWYEQPWSWDAMGFGWKSHVPYPEHPACAPLGCLGHTYTGFMLSNSEASGSLFYLCREAF